MNSKSKGGDGRHVLLASALGFNVNRLATLFRRRLTRVLRPWKLTAERWQVLAAVLDARDQLLSQSDIANVTLKDRHAVSRMLDGMETGGWIARTQSPEDARVWWIKAAPKAAREFPRVREALVTGFADDFAKVPQADREQLLRLLKSMIVLFDNERDASDEE